MFCSSVQAAGNPSMETGCGGVFGTGAALGAFSSTLAAASAAGVGGLGDDDVRNDVVACEDGNLEQAVVK